MDHPTGSIALATALLAIPPTYFVTQHADELMREGRGYRFAAFPLASRVDGDATSVPIVPALRRPAAYPQRASLAKFAMPLQRRALVAAAPDLIHQHHGTWSGGARAASRALGVPLVTTLHGTDVVSAARSAPRGLQRIHQQQTRAAFDESDLLLAVSDHQRRLALSAGAPAERLHVHYQGVDTDYFRPASAIESADRPLRLLFVGALIPQKRADLVIEASALISRHQEHELLIVGDGPERSRLEEKSASLPHVRIVGSTDRDGIRQWMQRSDALILPSHSEGAGLVILEAQACGMAAVVTGGDGKAEMVAPGRTGTVVDSENPSAADLAHAVLEWMPDGAEARRQIADAARSFVVTERSVHGAADILDTHYRTLLGR